MNISANIDAIFEMTLSFIERNKLDFVIQIISYCLCIACVSFTVWLVISLGVSLIRKIKGLKD